ncbi:hypothetical protein GCM10023193_39320 [Planotetraspora kaengkrachanensis]|uniref:Uncharacterized protein n=1 Tax=Planotetraspora kaengkrachanensis TaxID=575193 RepID=A0A8J3M683_9ACTN|nr:hypothetical protein Pka01_32520 [Planotetraspora kaengkrachanensis]
MGDGARLARARTREHAHGAAHRFDDLALFGIKAPKDVQMGSQYAMRAMYWHHPSSSRPGVS